MINFFIGFFSGISFIIVVSLLVTAYSTEKPGNLKLRLLKFYEDLYKAKAKRELKKNLDEDCKGK